MSKKMLIDATHTEETRVAVVDGGQLDEFDYESSVRKPLKGNIYLAKVTRVEPSLQAAFVNFGGNRHGFLPFSEIHPDYFRIPVSDREALMAEQEEALKVHDEEEEAIEAEGPEDDNADSENAEDAEDDELEELGGDLVVDADDAAVTESKKKPSRGRKPKKDQDVAKVSPELDDGSEVSVGNRKEEPENEANGNVISENANDQDGNAQGGRGDRGSRGGRGRGRGGRNGGGGGRGRNAAHRTKRVETYGGDGNEEQRFRFNLRRKYKIQEVIKRGQIMLVQVSKEERGNKGAAVGSYLSLPGRYCVLMPNSPRAGGVSRKISNYKDRAKMRDMMKELEVPKGMSVILRTAGVTRTKAEVKRDLDYLLRLWNTIRETTLESSAPALVYEEADLIKRAVRDLYTRDVDEIHVAGDEGYKTAKDFMKMMIPSHVKKVKEYKDKEVPLFNKFKVEGQIAEIGETEVRLRSGGYLVINPTEALISVDVNSGKATKERHIEETALKTNLEAAEEVARQLRLRDLGGLVVIDFIDMEERRNNGKVERRMRDSLSGDRARIQMGRISSFGLMELSRQRLSPSLTESQFETCAGCQGTGRIRTADAASIMVLRAIESEGIKGRASQVIVHVSNAVALYILNNKRDNMAVIENRYGFAVLIRVDETLGASGFRVEVSKPSDKPSDKASDKASDKQADKSSDSSQNSETSDDNDDPDNRRGGRRRGRRGGRGRGRNRSQEDGQEQQGSGYAQDSSESPKPDQVKATVAAPEKSDDGEQVEEKKAKPTSKKAPVKKTPVKEGVSKEIVSADAAEKPKKAPASKKKDVKADDGVAKPEPEKKKASDSKKVKPSNDDKPVDEPKEYEVVNEAPKNKKKGWWNKLTD